MASAPLPPDRKLRVVGDVHGDSHAFAYALATDRFVVQLGDLTDEGPDSAGALRAMLALVEKGRGCLVLGNHDRKLARALAGAPVRVGPALAATLAQLNADLRARALALLRGAPAWIVQGDRCFVHAAFHPAMLMQPPPADATGNPDPLLSRALFGQVTGETRADGYPVRRLDWIDRIPPGFTVYCGHDRRSTDGRPLTLTGAAGGQAVFLDTGAGKGGHLSWVDLD